MQTLSFKKETPQVSALKYMLVMAVGYCLLFASDSAFAQSTGFKMDALDKVMCDIYFYLANKVLFYVALIVAIVGILAYLLKMSKEVWGLLFVVALLIGIAQGLGGVISALGGGAKIC